MGAKPVTRRAGVVLGLLAATSMLAWAGAPTAALREASSAESAADQLAALAAAVAWLLLSWLVIGALLSAAARVPGTGGRLASNIARRIAPAVLRRTVDAALGLAIATSVVLPTAAHATPAPVATRIAGVSAAVAGTSMLGDRVFAVVLRTENHDAPAPGAVPAKEAGAPFDRPAQAPRAGVSGTSRPAERPRATPPIAIVHGAHRTQPGDADEIVIQRGESLWSIARRDLGAGSTNAEIDARWRRWYDANRAVIGTDPHLISPGTRLVVPPAP